jgi:hypothetical protein
MHYIPLPIQLYIPLMLAAFGLVFLTLTIVILADYGRLPFMQRALLGRQLRQVRMNRMLGMRGIPRAYYLRVAGLNQLRLDLARCQACASKARCDLARVVGPGLDPDCSFCPNAESLSRVQQGLRAGLAAQG